MHQENNIITCRYRLQEGHVKILRRIEKAYGKGAINREHRAVRSYISPSMGAKKMGGNASSDCAEEKRIRGNKGSRG